MDNYNVSVCRIDNYNLKIDPEIWDKKTLKNWSSVFNSVSNLEDLAEQLSLRIFRHGFGNFIEGFGYVQTFNDSGIEVSQFKSLNGELKKVSLEDYCKGISITLIEFDNDYTLETKNIEPCQQ